MPVNREELVNLFEIREDPLRCSHNALILTSWYDTVMITVRIVLYEFSSHVSMEITSMMILPESSTGNGFGSLALKKLLAWAKRSEIVQIKAIEVLTPSENFWIQNGFIRAGNTSNDFYLAQPS